MRRLAPLLALALLIPVAGCGQKPFKPFTPSEGGYTVLMPGTPNRTVRNEHGVDVVVYEVSRRNEGYAVAAAVIPPTGYDIDAAMSSLYPIGTGGRVQGQTRNGEGWREFEAETNDRRKFCAGRVIVTRGRFYALVAAGANAKLSNPEVRAFIDSFQLTDGPTPSPEAWGANPGAISANHAPPTYSPPPAPERPSDTPPPPPPPQASLPNPTLGAFRPTPPAEVLVGHPSDPTFRDEAPAGGWLVGFDVWYTKFFNNDIIGAVRPIYWANGAYALGQVHGTPTARGVRVVAKPNYTVGAVTVRAGLGIDALTVTFMKVNGEWLDKSDTYTSEQLGGPGGGPTDINGNGAPVTGIAGRKGTNLSGFGLVYRAAK